MTSKSIKEYPYLENLFEGSYHQDVWDDFDSDEEVWDDYISSFNKDDMFKFKIEIETILGLAKNNDTEFLNQLLEWDGITFDSYKELNKFLNNLYEFVEIQIKNE